MCINHLYRYIIHLYRCIIHLNSLGDISFYSRNDKLGVPFTAIVKESTLETGAIALRNRDTTVQVKYSTTSIARTLVNPARLELVPGSIEVIL